MNAVETERFQGAVKTPTLQSFRRRIGAGQSEAINALGTFFYVKDATAPFLIQADDGPVLPWDVGTGPNFGDKGGFTRLTLSNPTAAEIIVVVYVGIGAVTDNRFTISPSRDFAVPIFEARTEIVGWSANSIAGNSEVLFTGTPTTPQVKRKSIVISNLDNANTLYVKDAAGNFCAAVFFGTSITLPVSGPIKVVNTTAGSIPVSISEIWYVTNS